MAAKGLARTFQTPVVFGGMSVLETVLVGTYTVGRAGIARSVIPTPGVLREERQLREAAEAALARCGLAHLADVEADQLSLGHQKVLEIARGLAGRPTVLLLDEPAAGLNRAEKQRMAALLRELRAEGIALLLVEHDMEMVMELVDRVHVLEFGKTLRVGTPDEVRSDPEVIRAYLGVDEDEDEEGAIRVDH
ncbi:ABC transporter ATP-binding protein [Nonomuraea ferruginea]